MMLRRQQITEDTAHESVMDSVCGVVITRPSGSVSGLWQRLHLDPVQHSLDSNLDLS